MVIKIFLIILIIIIICLKKGALKMFFQRITASPGECLIVVKRRKLFNLGNGASCVVFPWNSFALIPTIAVEHIFQMHQESVDGITLRFKGIVIYQIVNAELASSLFDFTSQKVSMGTEGISKTISDICMGELRAIVSHMTMDQCIKERKTTLTEKLKEAVVPIVEGKDAQQGWGIKVNVLQVAQVYCPDEQLLAQLQAEARDEIKKIAKLSEAETSKILEITKIDSEKVLSIQSFQTEKEKLEERKKYEEKKMAAENVLKLFELENRKIYEEKRINTESALKTFELDKKTEIARKAIELKKLESQINEIEVESEAVKERTMMEIKKEILPLEQLPKISESLSGMFKDSRLTFFGGENLLINATKILNLIFDKVKEVYEPEKGS